VIELDYRIAHVSTVGPVERFTETITLPSVAAPVEVGDGFHALARLLALAAGTSYYKALVPGTISVAGGLTDAERHFLGEVVKGGLAEFAYRNDLPDALVPTIAARALPPAAGTPAAPTHQRALVAVGGGKDSIVTLESVRRVADVTLFSVNSYEPITRTAEASGLDLVHRPTGPGPPALQAERGRRPQRPRPGHRGELDHRLPDRPARRATRWSSPTRRRRRTATSSGTASRSTTSGARASASRACCVSWSRRGASTTCLSCGR
jgi:hypothetical protein